MHLVDVAAISYISIPICITRHLTYPDTRYLSNDFTYNSGHYVFST